jgi:hypothetical protein
MLKLIYSKLINIVPNISLIILDKHRLIVPIDDKSLTIFNQDLKRISPFIDNMLVQISN